MVRPTLLVVHMKSPPVAVVPCYSSLMERRKSARRALNARYYARIAWELDSPAAPATTHAARMRQVYLCSAFPWVAVLSAFLATAFLPSTSFKWRFLALARLGPGTPTDPAALGCWNSLCLTLDPGPDQFAKKLSLLSPVHSPLFPLVSVASHYEKVSLFQRTTGQVS